jgi:hypothetical protein
MSVHMLVMMTMHLQRSRPRINGSSMKSLWDSGQMQHLFHLMQRVQVIYPDPIPPPDSSSIIFGGLSPGVCLGRMIWRLSGWLLISDRRERIGYIELRNSAA